MLWKPTLANFKNYHHIDLPSVVAISGAEKNETRERESKDNDNGV